MKSNKLIYPVFIALLLLGTSCDKEYLETEPTEFITQEQLQENSVNNPALLRGTVTGIYSLMFETGTGGTTGHNDFGQKGCDIWSDMLTGDMALSTNTYNWYRNFCDYQVTVDFKRNENYVVWRYYYRIIRSTNVVIDALGGNDAIPPNQENQYLMGQAKALRAYAYFYLAQFEVNNYDLSQPILPIYTEPVNVGKPKSTAAEVYDLIISDLTDAISLLDSYTRTAKNQVDKNVAKGLLAYTYAAMGRNSEAATVSADIINNSGYPVTSAGQLAYPGAGSGFNDVNTPSWMWGVDLTTDQGLDLISWWGQMDVYTYSYAWAGDRKVIDNNLYNAIPSNDVRKTQFSASTKLPLNKFFAPGRAAGGQRNITTDYIYMRVDEFYLLNAETAAKSGDELTARNSLKALLLNRIPDVSYVDALTGQALLDEIYLQTRIELWGEGKSYLAMKRNRATINRGANHLFQVGVQVPYNDDRLSFEIPEAEILNNPFINDQN
ncbi:RagB/SusD family nutrient uptake outer membrane protein [Flavobacterium sp. NRK F7]|uniref:RagB/SusD family nutrient uptake outer membrane protein n=1 Tax=Flavobacterium sp. NRK F7 TaxID=2954930 RepID=UPI0020906ED2|nr:RagB/SusD family nutrient uptake outer membrane protein [Flavobacterium sp. NRK F7]MCO6162460.1 RagB/SusD family nutrient uptake outer membrane protein [Flavobacterium sp. NRK F7]